MGQFLKEQYREIVLRFRPTLARALPRLPEEDLLWRTHFVFGGIAYALAGNNASELTCNQELGDADDAEAVPTGTHSGSLDWKRRLRGLGKSRDRNGLQNMPEFMPRSLRIRP
jgi:Tetracyclin repressor-like, C-terminal domain